MQSIPLGRTGILVSRLAFGAGPVSGLMTGDDYELQCRTVQLAIQQGINWFDTAPGYGQGKSERNLGRVLQELSPPESVHLATKVRILFDSPQEIRQQISESVEQSLARLRVSKVTLLQLHNGITKATGDQPFSLSVTDILRTDGVISAFRDLQRQGMVENLGITGTGDPEALRLAINSGEFDTIQLPFNILNPSAGRVMPPDFREQNYGNILADCQERNLGVFAIRIFAGGAIFGAAASAHTRSTPFFPLDLYQRDLLRAENLKQPGSDHSGSDDSAGRIALNFALGHPAVHSAIIGFGKESHVDEAVESIRPTPKF